MNTLKALREKNNWTQEDLARKMKVSRTAITKWETGECMPKVDKLVLLADLFKCSVDFLLRDNVS